nr:hypothetical protein BHI3_07660 [Bacteriovorax sp. HI3]
MGAAQAAMGPYGALSSGLIESEYEMNKAAADRVGEEAKYNARLVKDDAVKFRKEQQASYAASGIELEGTAADVIKEDEVNANIEAMNIIYAGEYKKAMMKSQAKMNRINGYVSTAKDGGRFMLGAM